jgi:FKBP-type peptidyl-prolyl cis-trans isomerase FklB
MKKLFVLLIAVATIGVGMCQDKVKKSEIKTQKDKVSYSIGLDIGRNMQAQSIEVDPRIFLQGLKDGLSTDTSRARLLTDTEIQTVMTEFQKEMTAKMEAKQKAASEKGKKAGEAFLAANKKKPGVITLPSGLQYKILKSGTGKSPKAEDTVTTNYKGTLIDGTEFDSSFKRGEPAKFPVNGVIKGWTEALQLMKEGDSWELYIPSDLAYGDTGAGQAIAPGATLIFQVDLIKVN